MIILINSNYIFSFYKIFLNYMDIIIQEFQKAESKENFSINSSSQKNKDNYFTLEQLNYYKNNYPYKEFEKSEELKINFKK